jgi:hypothetical protein
MLGMEDAEELPVQLFNKIKVRQLQLLNRNSELHKIYVEKLKEYNEHLLSVAQHFGDQKLTEELLNMINSNFFEQFIENIALWYPCCTCVYLVLAFIQVLELKCSHPTAFRIACYHYLKSGGTEID